MRTSTPLLPAGSRRCRPAAPPPVRSERLCAVSAVTRRTQHHTFAPEASGSRRDSRKAHPGHLGRAKCGASGGDPRWLVQLGQSAPVGVWWIALKVPAEFIQCEVSLSPIASPAGRHKVVLRDRSATTGDRYHVIESCGSENKRWMGPVRLPVGVHRELVREEPSEQSHHRDEDRLGAAVLTLVSVTVVDPSCQSERGGAFDNAWCWLHADLVEGRTRCFWIAGCEVTKGLLEHVRVEVGELAWPTGARRE